MIPYCDQTIQILTDAWKSRFQKEFWPFKKNWHIWVKEILRDEQTEIELNEDEFLSIWCIWILIWIPDLFVKFLGFQILSGEPILTYFGDNYFETVCVEILDSPASHFSRIQKNYNGLHLVKEN